MTIAIGIAVGWAITELVRRGVRRRVRRRPVRVRSEYAETLDALARLRRRPR